MKNNDFSFNGRIVRQYLARHIRALRRPGSGVIRSRENYGYALGYFMALVNVFRIDGYDSAVTHEQINRMFRPK